MEWLHHTADISTSHLSDQDPNWAKIPDPEPQHCIKCALKKIIQYHSAKIEIHFPGLGFDKNQKSKSIKLN